MGNDLLQLRTIGSIDITRHENYPPETGIKEDDLHVTARYDPEYGKSVQITIGTSYTLLAENQVTEMIRVLQARMDGKDGYKSTDWEHLDYDEAVLPIKKRDEQRVD